MEKLLAFGRNGRIEFVGTIEEVRAEDACRLAASKHPLLTPIAESPLAEHFVPAMVVLSAMAVDTSLPIDPVTSDRTMLRWVLEVEYKRYGRFGDWGDVLTVIENNGTYILTDIAPKAYHRPGVATDLVPLLIDDAGHMFLLGVLRGKDPGKGKPALIGGFNDIRGFHFDSSAQTLFHESREEVGLCITFDQSLAGRDFDRTPFPETIPVVVALLGGRTLATAYLLGFYRTGQEERNESLGKMRVDFTAGYVMPVRVAGTLSKERLLAELIPQDLVENNAAMVLEVVGDNADAIEFGISHHRAIFLDAVQKARELIAAGKV